MIRIAIDGPGGAGKSTVAKSVASRLGIIYVDTGALYRTVGYYIRAVNVDPKDAEAVTARLGEILVELRYEDGKQTVYLNGEDLGDRIRTPEMSLYASAVSAIPAVREFLLETQRKLARENSVIMDGRDIGTVILPNADLKIFLTASDECRARRRYDELIAKGVETTYESVLSEMQQRDRNDREREVSPAVAAPDAILLDNSGMTPRETADAVIRLLVQKTGIPV